MLIPTHRILDFTPIFETGVGEMFPQSNRLELSLRVRIGIFLTLTQT